MKKIYYAGISALCLLCIACRENNTFQKNVPVKVKVQKVEAMKTKTVLKFSGTVEEENGTVVSFPVGGTLSQIPVSVGCYVAQGQLLASVDPSTMKNTYDAAQATLAQAQDAYTRMKQLYEKGSLPEIQWVEVQSKLQQAESMEHIAKKNLGDCHIYAPFSGIIAEKFMEIGQNAAPGIPVAKLVQITQVKIKISVPESEIADIAIGQETQIEVSALKNKKFTGKIIEKGVTANPLTHAYEVKILVENPKQELIPGMVAKVWIEKNEEGEQYILPTYAIQLDEKNNAFVWINRKGVAHQCMIKCGPPTAKGIIVISGLENGDEIIVEGQQKVSENTQIELI